MIPFDPADPYPLLPEGSHSYAEAQLHSESVDSWLGLRTDEIERAIQSSAGESLHADQQLWIGLPVKSLMTPYTEFRSILSLLDPRVGETVVDLGAAYGRLGFVMNRHYPGVSFVGYEYVDERVVEGRKAISKLADHSRLSLERADLSSPDFAPMPADHYFLYDYGTREAIEKTLQDLRAIASDHAITVVGRGRASRDAIERSHPWLSQVVEPEHHGHFSIYRSREKAKNVEC